MKKRKRAVVLNLIKQIKKKEREREREKTKRNRINEEIV